MLHPGVNPGILDGRSVRCTGGTLDFAMDIETALAFAWFAAVRMACYIDTVFSGAGWGAWWAGPHAATH